MKETIYTIPINEVFEQKCGCPMCTLAKRTETKTLEYIMGAAMMESDVRESTNREGFCARHYADMIAMNNRLSLALTIESRLKTVADLTDAFAKSPNSRSAANIAKTGRSCFVCGKVTSEQERYYENLLGMWRDEEHFRELFRRQEYFCLPHFGELLERANRALPRKHAAVFARDLAGIEQAWLERMRGEVSGFTRSFDYRYNGEPFEKEAVERAAAFLSGLNA